MMLCKRCHVNVDECPCRGQVFHIESEYITQWGVSENDLEIAYRLLRTWAVTRDAWDRFLNTPDTSGQVVYLAPEFR